jgi:hypothetical protein
MNTKKIIIGTILIALYLIIRFLTDFNQYSISFFYAYIPFVFILCYPMIVVALYLNKIHPKANKHCKLSVQRPITLGEASRIPGVTHAAISLLTIFMKKLDL